jgi:hypothetical protein
MDVDSVDIVRLRPDDPERESLIRGALIVKNAGWRDTYSGWLSSDYLDAQAARLDADVASWSRALADGRSKTLTQAYYQLLTTQNTHHQTNIP